MTTAASALTARSADVLAGTNWPMSMNVRKVETNHRRTYSTLARRATTIRSTETEGWLAGLRGQKRLRVARVFPRRTALTPCDPMAFVGEPPLWRPDADEVHVSVTFTWDVRRGMELVEAWRQYYPVVKLGGPAMGSASNGYVPGMYLREGVTFTSRGCNNHCPWCLVPAREGCLAEIEDFAAGNLVQDNNLLQCSAAHMDRVFAMLRTQRRVEFTGGLDARLLTQGIADDIRGLKLHQLFLACDTDMGLVPLERAIRLLQLPRDKVRCYVLCAFGTTIEECEDRMAAVWNAGAMPFAQLYQPPDRLILYSREWRTLARTWSRPAAMKAHMKGISRTERAKDIAGRVTE